MSKHAPEPEPEPEPATTAGPVDKRSDDMYDTSAMSSSEKRYPTAEFARLVDLLKDQGHGFVTS